ncbi:hypothetical protein KC333_g58 [Hortaea werneckii]|nr:hypothetical protein KC333_g58 [Hortaea werneckii]
MDIVQKQRVPRQMDLFLIIEKVTGAYFNSEHTALGPYLRTCILLAFPEVHSLDSNVMKMKPTCTAFV